MLQHCEDTLHWNKSSACPLPRRASSQLYLQRKIHCQPLKPPLLWSLRIPEAMRGLEGVGSKHAKEEHSNSLG